MATWTTTTTTTTAPTPPPPPQLASQRRSRSESHPRPRRHHHVHHPDGIDPIPTKSRTPNSAPCCRPATERPEPPPRCPADPQATPGRFWATGPSVQSRSCRLLHLRRTL